MDKKIIFSVALLVLLLSVTILGISGVKASLILVLIFFIPLALLLSKLNFLSEESIILGIFVSLGVIPTVIYYPGLIFSLRVLTIITVLILLSAPFVLSKANFFSDKK
ncbi:MAG: hypothetical protein QW331_03100 [Candidatus Woesearchaeota archaeon]